MTHPYDLVVLGSGAAAIPVAMRCRSAGWRVAMVEARELGGAGLRGTGGVASDWDALMAFKAGFTDPVPAQRAESLAERGIEVLHGHGRFAGAAVIAVGERTLDTHQGHPSRRGSRYPARRFSGLLGSP